MKKGKLLIPFLVFVLSFCTLLGAAQRAREIFRKSFPENGKSGTGITMKMAVTMDSLMLRCMRNSMTEKSR